MARTGAATARLRVGASRQFGGAKWGLIVRHRRVLAEILLVVLIATAVVLMGVDTVLRLLEMRDQHIALSIAEMDAKASLIAERLDREAAGHSRVDDLAEAQKLLISVLPLRTPANVAQVGLSDSSGNIIASLGLSHVAASLSDLVGHARVIAADRAGVMRAMTPDGVDSIIAIRNLRQPFGQIALVAPTSPYLASWREHARQLARIAAIVGGLILLLIGAMLWQRRRARSALSDVDKIRARMRDATTDIWRAQRELLEKDEALAITRVDLERWKIANTRQATELARLGDHWQRERLRAEDANRAKSEFLANMNHELRTPLNAIIGLSEIMENGLFGALGSTKYGEYVSDIRRSGQHLLAVFSDLLEMSCIEAGKRRIERRAVSLKDVVAKVAVSVAGPAEAKKLTLTINAPIPDDVEVDAAALVKVLTHLARNAIDHTPEGGSIKIKAKLYSSHVGIHIGDTGIGIPKHRLPHLGRPFERVNTDTLKPCPGTGLGLAIARAIVELHGGRLRIRSREGLGTVVALNLPRRLAA